MAQKKDNLPVNTEPVISDGGTISYANEVIAIISGIAASEIEGIAGMVTAGGLGEIISKNRNITRGVKVEVGTEEVSVDLYTIIEYGQPIQKVASEVQENVRKSIESMTGLKVVRVDIHVQGVSFEKDKKENQSRIEAANIQHITDSGQDKKSRKAEKEARQQEISDSKSKIREEKPVEITQEEPKAEKTDETGNRSGTEQTKEVDDTAQHQSQLAQASVDLDPPADVLSGNQAEELNEPVQTKKQAASSKRRKA
jgi:uncharacterized alkaline shock family protein YloU/phage antirepressor YoqD-like protein